MGRFGENSKTESGNNIFIRKKKYLILNRLGSALTRLLESCACLQSKQCSVELQSLPCLVVAPHIVPCGKFLRIGGAPPETFPSEKYDAPEEVGGDRKSFDSPIRK